MSAASQIVDSWNPADWRDVSAAQQPDYRDAGALAAVERALARADPVVSTADCVRLRTLAARVADGNGFILQGGDCAESLGQSTAATVSALAGLFDRLTAALRGETVRIGRIAGQFAKPRSTDWEVRDAVRLPVYRGDGINGAPFNDRARRADPERMLAVHAQRSLATRVAATAR